MHLQTHGDEVPARFWSGAWLCWSLNCATAHLKGNKAPFLFGATECSLLRLTYRFSVDWMDCEQQGGNHTAPVVQENLADLEEDDTNSCMKDHVQEVVRDSI